VKQLLPAEEILRGLLVERYVTLPHPGGIVPREGGGFRAAAEMKYLLYS